MFVETVREFYSNSTLLNCTRVKFNQRNLKKMSPVVILIYLKNQLSRINKKVTGLYADHFALLTI